MKTNKNLFKTFLIAGMVIMGVNQETPINANTQPESPESIKLTGTLRDFKAYRLGDKSLNPAGGHQDFQRYKETDPGFKIKLEKNLIASDVLDKDGKPSYKPGQGTTKTTTNAANFAQWYRDVPGVNQSFPLEIELTDSDGDGVYTFAKDLNERESFFPLDGIGFGNEGYQHNYHFTFEVETEFTYVPGTSDNPTVFTFKGDDDVFVYIDNKKVIDIGGIHSQVEQSVNVDRLGLTPGETYPLKLFFAERNVTHSNFRMDTNLAFTIPIQEEEMIYPD